MIRHEPTARLTIWGQPTDRPAPALVLASSSAARADLLTKASVAFRIVPATIDETCVKRVGRRRGKDAAVVALRLARLKARQVARHLAAVPSGEFANPFVVGSDQMLDLAGAWFDKPATLDAAAAQLRQLSGQTHRLWSAVSLWCGNRELWHCVEPATLTMRFLTDADIAAYLRHEGSSIIGSVGAYRIEGAGAQLFQRVDGSRATIMGLPLTPLLDALGRLAITSDWQKRVRPAEGA